MGREGSSNPWRLVTSMGVLDSRCPTCAKSITIVYQDRDRETLLVVRSCDCPSAKMARVIPG